MERKLTKKEQIRLKNFEEKISSYESKGYKRKDHLIDIMDANTKSLILAIPLIVLFGGLYYLIYNEFDEIKWNPTLLIVIIFFLGTIIHEGLHGLTWGMFSKNKFKSISFGIASISPYCSCSDPLDKKNYILGGLMPCIVLGIIPSIASLIFASSDLLSIGLFNILFASGDLNVFVNILKYKTNSKDILVFDHPTECGFTTLEK